MTGCAKHCPGKFCTGRNTTKEIPMKLVQQMIWHFTRVFPCQSVCGSEEKGADGKTRQCLDVLCGIMVKFWGATSTFCQAQKCQDLTDF